MTETKPKRRWFRFALRTLLLAVMILQWIEGSSQKGFLQTRRSPLHPQPQTALRSPSRPRPCIYQSWICRSPLQTDSIRTPRWHTGNPEISAAFGAQITIR